MFEKGSIQEPSTFIFIQSITYPSILLLDVVPLGTSLIHNGYIWDRSWYFIEQVTWRIQWFQILSWLDSASLKEVQDILGVKHGCGCHSKTVVRFVQSSWRCTSNKYEGIAPLTVNYELKSNLINWVSRFPSYEYGVRNCSWSARPGHSRASAESYQQPSLKRLPLPPLTYIHIVIKTINPCSLTDGSGRETTTQTISDWSEL